LYDEHSFRGEFMDYKKTGELIANIRKERGMTQKELADELFISDRTVSKWERGVGFPDVSLLEPLAKALDISISELVLGRKLDAEVDNIMSDDDIMKEAILILKREIAKQIRKKIIMTSIAVIFPFFIGIFFWSYIPGEIAILIGTNSPYISKAFAFTVPPIVLLIANAIHVAAIDGKLYNPKMSHGTTFVFPLIDAPTNTLSGKLYMLFKQGIYWIVPVFSFIGAIMTYVAAFRA